MRKYFQPFVIRTLYTLNVQSLLRNQKQKAERVTLLCLHRISSEQDYFWDPIKPENFEALAKYMRRNYDVIGISQLHEKQGKKPRAILSFDDGYYDFYSTALPILKHYGLPSNHNIVTDIVNGHQEVIWTENLNQVFNFLRNTRPDETIALADCEYKIKEHEMNLDSFYIVLLRKLFALSHAERTEVLGNWMKQFGLSVKPKKMMSWSDIEECVANRVDIGSHTKRHSVLSSITDLAELEEELYGSKIEIEKHLKTEVVTLAPPNGLYNDTVLKSAAKAGYKFVLGIGELSGRQLCNENIELLNRLNMISEPHYSAVMRVEELQAGIKSMLRRN